MKTSLNKFNRFRVRPDGPSRADGVWVRRAAEAVSHLNLGVIRLQLRNVLEKAVFVAESKKLVNWVSAFRGITQEMDTAGEEISKQVLSGLLSRSQVMLRDFAVLIRRAGDTRHATEMEDAAASIGRIRVSLES